MATSGVYPTTPLAEGEADALIRPVFFYNQLQRPGDTIALHLFEPRYRTMIGRANARVDAATGAPRREFVFLPNFVNYRCAQGDLGVLVELTQCHVSADGRANIRGELRRYVLLAAHWEEEHSGGLAYCRCRPAPAAFAPSPAQQRSTWGLAEALGGDSGHRMGSTDAVQPLRETPERPQIELSAQVGSSDTLARALSRASRVHSPYSELHVLTCSETLWISQNLPQPGFGHITFSN